MRNKKIIASISVVLLLCLAMAAIIISAKLNYSKPAGTWLSYQSKKYNYEVKYPTDWRLDDSQERLPYDAIFAPNNQALVTIGILALGKQETADNAVEEIKTQFTENKNYFLEQFEKFLGEFPGFRATGYFQEGKTNYQFEEWGVVCGDGRMFNLRAEVRAPDQFSYLSVLKSILESFSFSEEDSTVIRPFWEQKILGRAANLPEVKEFKQSVEDNNKSVFNARIATYPTQDLSYYLIQVYEIFPDHLATFGWYRYDPSTDNLSQENF